MTRIRLRQPALPLVIVFLLGLQITEASSAWKVLFVVFSGVFIGSYFWTWTLGKNLHVRRETRLGWVQVGGQIEERITLSNTSSLPAPWVEFIDRSTLPEFSASRSTIISAGHFDQWTVNANCGQRGLFTLGDALIRAGDPFGIFEVTTTASQKTSMLVLPQVANLPDLSISPSGTAGDGKPRRNSLQQTIHATTVREYLQGDGTRQIHWPTTARMNKVFVRLMESAPEGNWWILLDLNKRDMLGRGWESIEEQSVALTASLAVEGLRERKSVGLIVNGEELAWLKPQKGEGQRWEILQSLAVAKPGSLTLSELFERMHSGLGKHHSLIVVTSSPDLNWLKSLYSLGKRGIIPTVILFDPATFGGAVSAAGTAATLEQRGVRCHVVPRGVMAPPKIDTTEPAKWTWHATPSGEIVPVRR